MFGGSYEADDGICTVLLFHGDAPFLQSERLPNRADIAPGDVADLSALQADADGAG